MNILQSRAFGINFSGLHIRRGDIDIIADFGNFDISGAQIFDVGLFGKKRPGANIAERCVEAFVLVFGSSVRDINSADCSQRRFDSGGLQIAEPFKIRSRAANVADNLRKINAEILKRQKFGNRFAVQIVSRTFAVNRRINI